MTYIQRNQFLPENVTIRLITCITDSQIKSRDHLHTNFLGCLGEKKKPNRFHSYAITEGCHLQRSPGVQDLRFLDSSLLYTLTTNTFVPYLLENSCAGKKNKKDQWILLLFLAFVSSNYSFEKLLTEVIMSPAYLVTSTQKPWPWRIYSEFREHVLRVDCIWISGRCLDRIT